MDGYTLDGDATQTIDSVNGDATLTFTYTKDAPVVKKANVTVNYVDSEGKVLQDAKTLTDQEVGSSVSETAPEIDGYTVDEATKTVTVAKDGSATITFTYTKNAEPVKDSTITLAYVDEDGNPIQDSTTETVKNGTKYSKEAPAIDGYTISGDVTQTIDSVNGDATLTFTYTKNAPVVEKANVTVNYVDSEGKVLQDAKTLTDQTVGQDVTETAPTIDGYTVDEATKTVTVAKDGSATITFTYTKNAEPVQDSTITVKYVDADGNPVQDSTTETVKNGTKYSKDAPAIDGYTVSGDATQTIDSVSGDATQTIDSVSGDATLTFTYTKNAPVVEKTNVTVNYVDSEGKVLQDAKTLTDQEVGSSVSETAPEIDGYTVDEATKSVTVDKDGSTITFTYTKNAPATLDTTEVANKIISLVNEYRQQNGLSALNTDANLTAGAVARANTEAGHVNSTGNIDSANHDEFVAQTQPNLVQYGSTNMAENLAINGGSTADELAQTLVDQWKKSPDHNATMLDKSMTDIGVGVKQLDNGQYVAIQDFGGKVAETAWNADDFNSATTASLGYTAQDIKNDLMISDASGLAEGTGNYYIGDHVFKTMDDYENWVYDMGFGTHTAEKESAIDASIWTKGGVDAKMSAALIVDSKTGASIGVVPYITNMDKSGAEYISAGATSWY